MENKTDQIQPTSTSTSMDDATKSNESLRDKVGDLAEKLGHKISDMGAPGLGQKIHDLGDQLEESHQDKNHPHDV